MAKVTRSFRGGGSIEIDTFWVIDTPNEVATDVLALSAYLDNTAIPLGLAAGVIENDIRDRFDNEVDPGGMEWQDLSEHWAEFKQQDSRFLPIGDTRTGDYILRLTGDLYLSATDPGNFEVHGDTLVYQPTELPSYAGIHQHGGGNVPARPWAGISEEAAEEIFVEASTWVNAGVDEYFYDEGGSGFGDMGITSSASPSVQTSHTDIFTHTKGPHAGRQQLRIGGRFAKFL